MSGATCPAPPLAVEGKDTLQVVYFTTRDGMLQVRPPCCHLQRNGLSCTWGLNSAGAAGSGGRGAWPVSLDSYNARVLPCAAASKPPVTMPCRPASH